MLYEVITYLLPDPIETFKAAEILVKEGFTVLPYINADPVLAKRLQEIGTATVIRITSYNVCYTKLLRACRARLPTGRRS